MGETPSHTGSPPHIVMLLELFIIQEKLNKSRDDIKNLFVTELDKRDIEGGMHHANKILEKTENSHARILDRLEMIGIQNNSDKNKNPSDFYNMFGSGGGTYVEPRRLQTVLYCYNGACISFHKDGSFQT